MCLSRPRAYTPPPPPPPAPPPPVLDQQAPARAAASLEDEANSKGKSKSNRDAKGSKGYQNDLSIPTNSGSAVGGDKGASGVNVAN